MPAAVGVSTTANQFAPNPAHHGVGLGDRQPGPVASAGPLAWQLVGPLPVPGGGCSAVTGPQWAAATVFASGTKTITGDQSNLTVPAAGTTVGAPGCYSWAETVSGSTFPGTTTVAAGAPGEFFEVQTLQPTLSTTINPSVIGGVESATDSITVARDRYRARGTPPADRPRARSPGSSTDRWPSRPGVRHRDQPRVDIGGPGRIGDHHGDRQHHLHHTFDVPHPRELLLLQRDLGCHHRQCGLRRRRRSGDRDGRGAAAPAVTTQTSSPSSTLMPRSLTR